MSETRTFDIIVVGGGMFGSACAKYLSQLGVSLNVALIGPQEPHDRADTDVSIASNRTKLLGDKLDG